MMAKSANQKLCQSAAYGCDVHIREATAGWKKWAARDSGDV